MMIFKKHAIELHPKPANFVPICLIVLPIILCACASTLRNQQLEAIAKDWSLVIRASQIIPVYPLTEDLQPGDVLLVSTPIEDQVKLYKEKGFLPLDQLLTRIYKKKPENATQNDFAEFYNDRYGITDKILPPKNWQKETTNNTHNWQEAPHAAFPPYQFTVDAGSGLNLAIPIEGVPFALGLMNSSKAHGSVTIANSFTYALDNAQLEKRIRKWASSQRAYLRSFEPQNEQYQFLRVISRVYLTGEVNVSITNDEIKGGTLGGGADRPVEMFGLIEGASRENYTNGLNALSKMAAGNEPGGKISILTATSRSISMTEKFDKPLVIGYVGFDIPILEGGRLGPAISTLNQLSHTTSIPPILTAQGERYRLAALTQMYSALKQINGTESETIQSQLDQLDRFLPAKYSFSMCEYTTPTEIEINEEIVEGSNVEANGFQSVLDYIGYALKTTETLERYLKTSSWNTENEKVKIERLQQNLRNAQNAERNLEELLSRESIVLQAIDYVFLGD